MIHRMHDQSSDDLCSHAGGCGAVCVSYEGDAQVVVVVVVVEVGGGGVDGGRRSSGR